MRARDHGILIGEGTPGPENAITRVGGLGEHSSGDLFLCFATGDRGMTPGDLGEQAPPSFDLRMLSDAHITGLFEAVVEATEEAIVNALIAATTTEGRDGIVARGRDGEQLAAAVAGGRCARTDTT